jgi:hypothetical protein
MNSLDYLYVDLARREVLNSEAGDLKTFTNLIAGQKVQFALRFYSRLSNGDLSEVNLDILSLRVGLGRIDARPESGWYRIQVGEGPSTQQNTTREIEWSESAIEIEEALNALPLRPDDFVCNEENGSISLRLQDGSDVPLHVYTQGLKPLSIGRIERVRVGGVSVYYLRLIQAPVSFSDGSERRLPAAPSIKTLQNGGYQETSQSIRFWNEIQELTVPSDFRGSYQFRTTDTFKRSAVLDRLAGIQEIQTALNDMFRNEDGAVKVTNPATNIANIEFGSLTPGIILSGLQARDIPELVVEVFSAPPGSYIVDLDLSTAGIADLLRNNESVTLPFEAEALVYKNPDEPSEGVMTVKLWSTEASVRRPMLWDGLANNAPAGWQSRIIPKDYIPFTNDQILIGQQQAVVRLIGVQESIIDHNLGGSGQNAGVVAVIVRDAANNGIQLQDAYYTLRHPSVNSINIKIDESAYLTKYVGDGVKTTFAPKHPLSVPLGAFVQSVQGSGYVWNAVPNFGISNGSVVFTSAPPVGQVIAIGGIPGPASIAVSIIGYGPASQFQAHTHTMQQIQGLSDFINNVLERVTNLEKIVPRGGAVSVASSIPPKSISIPSYGEILPDLAIEGTDGVSIASQISGVGSSNATAAISGTALQAQQKEQEAAALRIKAEEDAKLAAAQEAARAAAEQVKVKAVQEAVQKKTSVISKVVIQQFGTISETTTNQTSTTTSSTGTTTTVTPVTVKTLGPTMFPSLRGGKYPMLLPAIHSATALDLASLPSVAGASGIVYRNTGTVPLVLPAGGGRKAQSVAVGGYFGGDGRALYALRKAGITNSYHPIEMERELIRVVVRAAQFQENSVLSLPWQLDLSFLTSNITAGAGYVMPVEVAPLPDAASPAPLGVNTGEIGQFVLLGAPRITFSRGIAETRQFSLKLSRIRELEDGQSILRSTSRITDYGIESIGPAVPAGDFLLTVRLAQWDVDDSSPLPTGQVGVLMPATQMTIEQTI